MKIKLNSIEKTIINNITQEDWMMVVSDSYPLQRLGELNYIFNGIDLNASYDLDTIVDWLKIYI